MHEDMNEKHSEEMKASKTEFKIPDSQAYSSGKNPGTRTPIEINVQQQHNNNNNKPEPESTHEHLAARSAALEVSHFG